MNLIERLNQIAEHDWRVSLLGHASDTAAEAVARIAELEAEAASHRQIEEMVLRAKAAHIAKITKDAQHALDVLGLRVHELEAERDRLKAALRRLDEMTVCTSSHVYVGEGVFEDWQQISRQIIRAALSGEGVTK